MPGTTAGPGNTKVIRTRSLLSKKPSVYEEKKKHDERNNNGRHQFNTQLCAGFCVKCLIRTIPIKPCDVEAVGISVLPLRTLTKLFNLCRQESLETGIQF